MATTQVNGRLEHRIDAGRSLFSHIQGQLRKALARRKSYVSTCNGLGALSDRSLKDLGIPRCSIKNLAKEAADDS
ncbi:DUF1127 domain-containing protein [Lentibacter algarum]|uniref:DUF1127 domain-containing protein n=1 Tax=Lentibacter algarum TaxID=576131 RepID=UPI001C07460C|nr:DUF1127 domain-containing protein [Lentibacter algarum]MBU2981496.1 DUF1127 domain-containing protein [Lentibacter algarum]